MLPRAVADSLPEHIPLLRPVESIHCSQPAPAVLAVVHSLLHPARMPARRMLAFFVHLVLVPGAAQQGRQEVLVFRSPHMIVLVADSHLPGGLRALVG